MIDFFFKLDNIITAVIANEASLDLAMSSSCNFYEAKSEW
jgi:hypothetical protein